MIETSVHAEAPNPNTQKDSVVFALGFLHLGEKDGTIMVGEANMQLAQVLERCAGISSLVLTQKAVSGALANPRALHDGTPVLQMHRHDPQVPVRTLAALMCGLERLSVVPDHIVLLAHPRHLRRALMDLKALYDGEILVLCPGKVAYPGKHWTWPIRWALKNVAAWPVDFLLIQSIKYRALALLWCILRRLGIRADCPEGVRLSSIKRIDGEWQEL